MKFETITFINSQNRAFYTYVLTESSWNFDSKLYAFSSHCILLMILKNTKTCSALIHVWFQKNTQFEAILCIESNNRASTAFVSDILCCSQKNHDRFVSELCAYSNYCILLIILINNKTCPVSIHVWFHQNMKFETIPYINSQERALTAFITHI